MTDELVRFQKGWDGDEPLTYPFTEIPEGGEHSRLVSPRVGNPHGLPTPIYPEDDGFDAILAEAIEVRVKVLNDEWPADFLAKHHPRANFDPERIPVPLQEIVGKYLDPEAAARSVVGDHHLAMPTAALRWLLTQNPVSKRTPATGHNDFLERDVYVTENLADAAKRNMNKAFEAKCHFGLPRIEEVLHVDGAILTASINGCPCHGSYPAGHAAAASSVGVLDREFHLIETMRYELFDSAYLQAMFRTLGAFHYAQDNIAGLMLGGIWKEYWHG